jgi:rhodanese-related sulfurtransferase
LQVSFSGPQTCLFSLKLLLLKNVYLAFLLFISSYANAQIDSAVQLTPDAFEKGVSKEGIQLLDVRTAGEYSSGHIPHSLQADWTNKDQFFSRVQFVDKDKPVYVYCLVGARSAAAAEWMRKNGFSQVFELRGGINAWKQANKPLEGMSNEKQMTIGEFNALIQGTGIVLVNIGAPWCPPCLKMEPIIKELASDNSLHFKLVNIDAGIQTNLLKTLAVDPIPVFIIYKNGKEVWRKIGIVGKPELKDQLK